MARSSAGRPGAPVIELRVSVRTTKTSQPTTVTMIASCPMSMVLSDAGAARMGSGDRLSLPH